VLFDLERFTKFRQSSDAPQSEPMICGEYSVMT
jgi:hypothetical protein